MMHVNLSEVAYISEGTYDPDALLCLLLLSLQL